MTVIEISPSALAILMLLLSAFLAFMANAYWKSREVALAKAKADREEIEQLQREMVQLQDRFGPFWTSVQSRIVQDLTHPSPQFAEMDGLLAKLDRLTITDDERVRLEAMLRMRAVNVDDPEVTPAERRSAEIMIVVMHKVLAETAEAEAGLYASTAEVDSFVADLLTEKTTNGRSA